MSSTLLLIPAFLPMLAALVMCSKTMENRRARNAFVMAAVSITSVCLMLLVIFPPEDTLTLIRFSTALTISFKLDGLGRVFAAIIAVLWPLTTIYAFDYMRHEGGERRFYAFFMVSYGVTAGLTMAANLITMYTFFELLTLATLPLVMHEMDDKARYAGKRYLLYSMTGAAMGFIAVALLYSNGVSGDFTLGGIINAQLAADKAELLRVVFVLAFFGFGVKAALFPMSAWLPIAGVAPTPVTALLHAVAVVKAGAFACMRLTYYCFGTDILYGTWAQYTPMCATIITIVLGSAMALRTKHFKRRLAWSTVSNLSYILLGVCLMTPNGLQAASQHMIYHAFMKITLFFCAGAVLVKQKKEYVYELDGMARSMPVTCVCFTLAGAALMGLVPLPGFFSKWALGSATIQTGSLLGYVGAAALIVSALLTALYIMGVAAHMFGPAKKGEVAPEACTESALMNVPLIILCVMIVALGLCSGAISSLLAAILS